MQTIPQFDIRFDTMDFCASFIFGQFYAANVSSPEMLKRSLALVDQGGSNGELRLVSTATENEDIHFVTWVNFHMEVEDGYLDPDWTEEQSVAFHNNIMRQLILFVEACTGKLWKFSRLELGGSSSEYDFLCDPVTGRKGFYCRYDAIDLFPERFK